MERFQHIPMECDGSVGNPCEQDSRFASQNNAFHNSAFESASRMIMVPVDNAHNAPRFSTWTGETGERLEPVASYPLKSHSSCSNHEISMEDETKELNHLATTHLLGGSVCISQDEFVLTIRQPGAGALDLCELFDFRRPKTGQRAKSSKILLLDDKQLDAMYALAGAVRLDETRLLDEMLIHLLAGCCDVLSVMSSVGQPARDAMWDIYGIDKLGFSTWFKNRRLVPKERATGSPRSSNSGSHLRKMRHSLSSPASEVKKVSSATGRASIHHLASSDQQQLFAGLLSSNPSLPGYLSLGDSRPTSLPPTRPGSGTLTFPPSGAFERPYMLKPLTNEAIADALQNATMMHQNMMERERERKREWELSNMQNDDRSEEKGEDGMKHNQQPHADAPLKEYSFHPNLGDMNTSEALEELDNLLSHELEWLKTV